MVRAEHGDSYPAVNPATRSGVRVPAATGAA
jgi:hypothetical protein